MRPLLLAIPVVLSLVGCMNPNLCGTKKSVGKKGLSPEHLEFFENKPSLSVAEAHGTILPLAHTRQHLQKRSSGYRYVNHVSLLGGLLLEGSSTQNFDENGKPQKDDFHSASLSMLSGLLFEIDVDAYMNDLSGSMNKSFLLKAFGSTKEVGGSKYYTVFWMPMKFSDNSIGSEK